MPERLTESLIRQGLLNEARAKEAIQRQVLLGGALDTCLLELKLIEEPELLDAMAGAYGLATSSIAEALAPVDEHALRAFPEQWAKKHTVAPLSLDEERSTLTLLSPAPADVNLLVRLGELLELTIKPLLAPEFRVHQRLSLIYEEKAAERFKTLIEQIGGSAAPGGVHAKKSELSAPVIVARPLTFGEAVTRLRGARDRDDIVRIALAYVHHELEFAAMLRVHELRLEGWDAAGEGARAIGFVSLPIVESSAFRVVLDTHAHYLGPLPEDDQHEQFLEQLGRPHPRAALIVPVRIKNRTVALLYGDNGPRTIPPRVAADLMLFVTHVQSAFEALLVRRKVETLSELPASDRPSIVIEPPIEADQGTPVPVLEPAVTASAADQTQPMPVPVLEPEPAVGAFAADQKQPMPAPPPPVEIEIEPPTEASSGALTEPIALAPAPKGQDQIDQISIEELNDQIPIDAAPTLELLREHPNLEAAPTVELPRADPSLAVTPVPALSAATPKNGAPTPAPSLEDAVGWSPSTEEAAESEGWDSVQVEAWDDAEGFAPEAPEEKAERIAMRASLNEDSTLPDLSAEAWLRASSDLTRPRVLPPEVIERAAMPEPDEPLPLTHPVQAGIDDDEPIALTRPTSSILKALSPLEEELEPVPLIRPVTPPARTPSAVKSGPSRPAAAAASAARPVDEKEIDRLVDLLMAHDPGARKRARDALTAMGPPVLPKVDARFPGILAVNPFQPGAVLPPFVECSEVLAVMAELGAEAHPYVVRRLDAPDPVHRFFAIYFYGAVQVPDAIPRLTQRLHDEEPRICMLAARTLFGYRERPEFRPVLEHLHGRLNATSIAARRHAAYLLGLFRDVSAIPLLIDVFEKKERVIFDAVEGALGEITKQRLGPNPKKWRTWWLKNQMRSRIGWLVDGLSAKEPELRRSAAEELRAITGIDMGYDEDAPRRSREDARMRWVRWWSEQGGAQEPQTDADPASAS